jgi:SAM-dependent methyltransferase
VADLPVTLAPDLTIRLVSAFDREGKIPRALHALGPVTGADCLLVGGGDRVAGQLTDLGAQVMRAEADGLKGVEAGAFDIVLGCWSWFRDDLPATLASALRPLRPSGRLLVLHDYGRDDVSRLRPADLPEYTMWGRRDGWFLRTGFKVRVIHAWWTFDALDEAAAFLSDAFDAPGRDLAAALKRPRLSYNVAIYHRGIEAIAAT